MGRVPSKPRRRTYRTGGNLPAISDEYRPIPLGRDSNGDFDEQIRAMAVLIKNRSDSSIYIREGPDTDDSHEIKKGEDYRIWEPNGVSSINLKGEVGDEVAEFRTLEAHNDFSFVDRIEAFTRSIAHFMGTATANTTITGQDVDLTIDDAGGINVNTGTVDIGTFADTVTIDDIQAGTIDANVTNGSLTVDSVTGGLDANVSGSVDVGTFSDTVTVDDIQAGSVNIGSINGQNLNLDANGNLVVGDIQAGTIDANVSGSVTVDDILAGSVDIGTVNDGITVDTFTAGTLDANITNSSITVDNVTGGLDVNTGSITIDDIVNGIEIDTFTAGTLDANITNSTLTVDSVTGGMDVNTGTVTVDNVTGGIDTNVSGNVVVDDITATNANFDGDITGQGNFDLSTADRLGKKHLRTMRDTTGSTGSDNTWTLLDPSGYDGAIEYVNVRLYYSNVELSKIGAQVEIDRGNTGVWERVSPRGLKSGLSAKRYSAPNNSDVSVSKFDATNEVIMEYNPREPVTFSIGDSVRINVTDAGEWSVTSGESFNCELEVSFRERVEE